MIHFHPTPSPEFSPEKALSEVRGTLSGLMVGYRYAADKAGFDPEFTDQVVAHVRSVLRRTTPPEYQLLMPVQQPDLSDDPVIYVTRRAAE